MTVQTVNLMAIATSNTKMASASKSDGSFDSFLETGNKGVAKAEKATPQPTATTQHSKDNVEKQTVPATSQKNVDVQEKPGVLNEYSKMEETAQMEVSEENTVLQAELEELPDDVLAKILSLLNEVVSVLQNSFQLGEQPLLEAAESIQFELTDFLDVNRMKELFLQVQGLETADLLTNEDLYRTLEQLQGDLLEILDNSGLEQLLTQEGFSLEQFDVSMFKEQISEYVKAVVQPVVVNDAAEVVIEFEHETDVNITKSTEHFSLDGMETVETVDGTTTESETGFAQEDQSLFESDKQFDQATMFLQKLTALSRNGETESIQQLTDGFELYDIARQIIDQVKIQIRPDNTKMEIQLNPEHLGKVELEITSKNGELSARLNVQSDHVKEAVESQMQVLRETLEVQGLKVENIEVTVAEFGFRFQDESAGTEQKQQRQRRNGRVAFDDTDADEPGFSDVSEVMKEMNGNSVDYVA